MSKPSLKTTLLAIGILTIPLFGYFIWTYTVAPETLSDQTVNYAGAGKGAREDLELHPALAFTESDKAYTVEDTATDGIQITFANSGVKPDTKPKLNLSFPKDYAEPIEVKLDDKRSIQITDLSGKKGYSAESLQTETLSKENQGFFASIFKSKAKDAPKQYLRYVSDDGRKSLLYAFQKDQATGEKKLKHWTLYQSGTGLETEEYKIENAKVRITEGKAEVFYYGEQDLQNEAVKSEVDSSLLERAQRTLAKDMGDDLLSGNHTPDFSIPTPYYLDREGEKHEASWKWNEESKTLSVTITPGSYPVALDPTLSFTVPGVSNSGSVITGEGVSNYFGTALATGDFNADGRTDLAVGTDGYGAIGQGRMYIFYNDGSINSNAGLADIKIDGVSTSDLFGRVLEAGDFNFDGKTDIAVGSFHSTAYIFYNDGSYPTSASSADVTITGSNEFSNDIAAGDYNADGRTDLAIGEYMYSSYTGRAYIFYNDGSIPTTSATADVTITGNAANDVFGTTLVAGDFNSDGKTDLAISGYGYSSETGRIYLFYNDGSIPTTAATADLTITGDVAGRRFGQTLAVGDFNTDGRIDLAAGSPNGGGGGGFTFIFYNDGSIPTSPASADVTITNSTTHGYLGSQIVAGDMNGDGRTDLISSASDYTLYPGAIFIFYNDGSIPTDTIRADVIIEGESTAMLGSSLAVGDLNADGRADLVAGGKAYASYTGRTYIFYSQNGQVNTNQSITGEATSNYFGSAIATGDFNTDGRTDLAVGANAYSSNTGRVYVFYGDGQIPSTAASADAIITGETTSNSFGITLSAGDFNTDGKVDIAVGARGYSSNTGRAYIFYNGAITTENATGADVTITGEASSGFGGALASGDFNANGTTDLVIGAYNYTFNTGRAYVLYNDGSIPTTAASADAIITGESTSTAFGSAMMAGDFNADGKIDLIIGAYGYSSSTGRAYIFYNGSITTENASGADLTITGETTSNQFSGTGMAAGDFNADGRIDLAIGANIYGSFTGRAYIFYNDGSIPTTAATADVIISGETGSDFGYSMTSGDLNADGRTDLAIGADGAASNFGRAYIFYNDGSIPTTAATADIIITGEAASNYLGGCLTTGDFNADGRPDLIVGAMGYSTNTGKVYFYETRENFSWQIQKQFVTTGSTRTSLGAGQEIQITGEIGAGSNFAASMITGDLNADGKPDLIVGANNYSTTSGRLYIFYSDGSFPSGASSADNIISGEANYNSFGATLAIGDMNADGKADLIVGASGYSTGTGRAYVFYNDGSYPNAAASADLIITGNATNDSFGSSVITADFNTDGRTDLAVGANGYSSSTGRAYIFYNDGSLPSSAGTADVTITGNAAGDSFGSMVAAGDVNADSTVDLVISAPSYSTETGRAYIFYNDGSIPTTAGTADVTITGETTNNDFGSRLEVGDLNADGRVDLVVSAYRYNSYTGRVYIFNNDGSIPTTAASADVIIAGSGFLGSALATGDFNADGRIDLAAGADYNSSTYIFYNDGSIPTTTATADMTLTGGETTPDYYGGALAAGDFNADGRTDIVVGAWYYQTNTGRAYLYTFNDPVILGGTTDDNFGWSLVSGDFNADGRTDLAVGAHGYSTNTGRVYVFYNDGAIPSAVASADAIITGEATNQYFGTALAAGDFNADGKIDLVVSAPQYPTNAGRIYFFYSGSITTENASGADYFITGNRSGRIGAALATGDLNSDGKTDLVATLDYSGEVAVFYNDGTIPTDDSSADFLETVENVPSALATGDFNSDGRIDFAVSDTWTPGGTLAGSVNIYYNDGSYSTPDVTITGENANDTFGTSLASGDWNADGRTDLAVGAQGYTTSTGRAYVFYNDGSIPTTAATADVIITGEGIQNHFGYALTAADLNVDGKSDLVVGAQQYGTNYGRAYVFYNGSIMSENASGADSIMTGTGTGYEFFGHAFAVGDFNTDGKNDLAVGAYFYSSQTGRVYFFASEASSTNTPPGVMTIKGTGKLKGNVRWK